MPTRRRFLAALGLSTVGLAGCTDVTDRDDPGQAGGTPSPDYGTVRVTGGTETRTATVAETPTATETNASGDTAPTDDGTANGTRTTDGTKTGTATDGTANETRTATPGTTPP